MATAPFGIGGYDLARFDDRICPFDYNGSGNLDSLLLYRPGASMLWIVKNFGGTFSSAYRGTGIGGYDLTSPADRIFAFDCHSSGKLESLVLYRPGTGTAWIVGPRSHGFIPVFESTPGRGSDTAVVLRLASDLASPATRLFPFDYDHSGKLDALVAYSPGIGTVSIARNKGKSGDYPAYELVYQGNGIGGYDLASPADRVLAFDYDHSGKLDFLVLYRSGHRTIWILKNAKGSFSPVYKGTGIAGYDLVSPADRAVAFDFDHSGKEDYLVLYRPGRGAISIAKNDAGRFTSVYAQPDSGKGIGGYDVACSVDEMFAFDYGNSHRLDHLVLYRPGAGRITILGNTLGSFEPAYTTLDNRARCQGLNQSANPSSSGTTLDQISHGQVWRNWGIIDVPATSLRGVGMGGGYLFGPKLIEPRDPYEIAHAVADAERSGTTARALGSGWSFSDAVLPQSSPLPNTPDWPSHLDEVTSCFGYGIDTSQMAASLQDLLPGLLLGSVDEGSLLFVEAGIKLGDLNTLLDRRESRLALRTLGGSAGQTLAGAISTGTHGGDFDQPPLADSVRTIYLIGAQGVHHWIEPTSHITDAFKLQATFPCLDIANIHYDDDMFRAALVSMGSMGVIYALVLDVVPQFSLMQCNRWSTWEVLKRDAGDQLQGLFDGSWTGIDKFIAARFPPEQFGRLSNRFLQIVINPIGNHGCYVSNRVAVPLQGVPSGVAPGDLSSISGDDIANAIQSAPEWGLGSEIDFFLAKLHGELAGASLVDQANALVSFSEAHGYSWAVRAVLDFVFQRAFPEPVPGPQIDVAHRVMTGSVFGPGFPMFAVTSVEAAFNFGDAVAFVDTVLRLFDNAVTGAHYPAGYLSLRACGRTNALLGMQQFARTGAVEVSLLGSPGNFSLVESIESAALQNKPTGILHWGQSNGIASARDISNQFPKVAKWRAIRERLGGKTFVNLFLQRCGLV